MIWFREGASDGNGSASGEPSPLKEAAVEHLSAEIIDMISLARLLARMGRFDEAVKEANRAINQVVRTTKLGDAAFALDMATKGRRPVLSLLLETIPITGAVVDAHVNYCPFGDTPRIFGVNKLYSFLIRSECQARNLLAEFCYERSYHLGKLVMAAFGCASDGYGHTTYRRLKGSLRRYSAIRTEALAFAPKLLEMRRNQSKQSIESLVAAFAKLFEKRRAGSNGA